MGVGDGNLQGLFCKLEVNFRDTMSKKGRGTLVDRDGGVSPGTGPCWRVAQSGRRHSVPALKGLQVQTRKARKVWPSCFTSATHGTVSSVNQRSAVSQSRKGDQCPLGSQPSSSPSFRIACHPSPEPGCPGSQDASPSAGAPK